MWYTYTPQGTVPAGSTDLDTIDYATNPNWTATSPAEQRATDTFTQLMNYAMGDFGVGEVLFGTMTQATADGKTLSVAGSVTFLGVLNTSKATIMKGALINQNTASSNPGSVVVQALSTNQSVNFIGNINLPTLDITSDKLKDFWSSLHGGSGSTAGDEGTAVGASLLFSLYGDDTEAVIQSGAKVNAYSLYVDAETNVLGIGIGASGGGSGNVGILGTASANYVNDTTLAQIQSGAVINVGNGLVSSTGATPPQDGSVVVNAVDTDYVITVDGVLEQNLNLLDLPSNKWKVGNQAVAVGASAGLNIIERDTQAVIGDLSGTGAPAGSFTSGGDVWVNADNEGYAVVVAVTGSVANPKPAEDSGSGMSKNPGTGGTQGSDGSSTGNANLLDNQTKWNAVLTQMVAETPVKGDVASLSSDVESGASKAKAGVAISGSAGVNVLIDTTDAWITNAPMLNIDGSLSLSAENNTNVITVAGAGSLAISKNNNTSVAAAGAFALNVLEGSTDASIIGAAGLAIDGALNIDSKRNGWVVSAAAGLAGATGSKGYAVGGSVGVNILLYTTTSELENTNGTVGSTLLASSGPAVSMDAQDDSLLVAVGGAGGFGGKAGVGVGIGFTYEATKTESTVLNVGTSATPFSTSTGEMDVQAANNELLIDVTGSAGIATGSGGSGYAGAGTVSVNYTQNTISAAVENSFLNTGKLDLAATNNDSIYSFAGALSIGKNLGLGAAIGVNLLFDNVTSTVSGSTINAASFSSNATEGGTMVTAAIGGAGSSKLAIAGSIAFNLLDSDIEATVVGSTIVSAGEFSLKSEEEEVAAAGSGGVAISTGTAGIGAAVAVNLDLNKVNAEVENLVVTGSPVTDSTVDGSSVSVTATSGEIMVTVALGGGGGENFALGGSVAVSVADGSITASAVGGSMIESTGTSGNVMIAASDDSTVITVSGGFAGSEKAAVGISASTADVSNTTEAVVDNSNITSEYGNISVTAGFVPQFPNSQSPSSNQYSSLNLNNVPFTLPGVDSSQIYDLSVAGSGAGKVAVGLAITVNTVTNTVEALVQDGSTVTATVGSVTVGAYDQSTINTLALGAAGAGNVAVGGAIAVNVIKNTIDSDIDDSTVSAGTTFELDAETTAIIRAVGIGVSGSGTVAVSVSALGNAVANTISALITNGSTVTSGGNATITASETAPYRRHPGDQRERCRFGDGCGRGGRYGQRDYQHDHGSDNGLHGPRGREGQ
jgi:hypothetical protein